MNMTRILRILLEVRGELEKKPPQIAMAIESLNFVIQALSSAPRDDDGPLLRGEGPVDKGESTPP